MRDGMVAQGEHLMRVAPDVIVINACHLITTFPTVVDGTPRHQGVLTAQEAPDLIGGMAYDFPGALRVRLDALAGMLAAGDLDKLWAWLPEYCARADPGMGGRHLAMLLGALMRSAARFAATVHAWGPSSGSGNYVISLAREP